MSAPGVIAVIGLGEAGSAIATDLVAAGVSVRGWDPGRDVPEGVEPAGDEAGAARGAAIVLSLNSAAVAVEVAAGAAPGLDPGALFADMNAAAPAVKRAAAEAAGATFADVALLGAVPGRGLATPALASGPGAERFAQTFGELGMPVTAVGPEVGDASARKLARSVFAKGLAAAVGESLDAALLRRLVEGSRLHAGRRVEEMAAAVALLEELGVDPRVASATEQWLRSLDRSEVNG